MATINRMCTARLNHLERETSGNGEDMQAFPADPLEAFTPLPFEKTVFPYGFPARIRSNSAEIIQAADVCWSPYSHHFREPPIELRFLVSDQHSHRRLPIPVFRAQANLLSLIADANNFGCCDLASGLGFAVLTPAAVAQKDYLRYHFLESMAYSLLDTRHLAMVHAACIGRGGQGVLLAGESGAGKSSLAYACTHRGWTYVSDDASSMVLRSEARTVVGNPRTFRFRPTAKSLFPELQGRLKFRNGKPTLEVRTERLPHVKTAYQYTVEHVVFLKRRQVHSRSAQLTPISRTDCLQRLFNDPWPLELPVRSERMAAIERLACAPAFELNYQEFGPAIDLLDQLVL
jgi:hypothetical protein